MKIVFESEDEKRQFMEAGCPHDIPTIFTSSYCGVYYYDETKCTECWKNSGVILEVANGE